MSEVVMRTSTRRYRVTVLTRSKHGYCFLSSTGVLVAVTEAV